MWHSITLVLSSSVAHLIRQIQEALPQKREQWGGVLCSPEQARREDWVVFSDEGSLADCFTGYIPPSYLSSIHLLWHTHNGTSDFSTYDKLSLPKCWDHLIIAPQDVQGYRWREK